MTEVRALEVHVVAAQDLKDVKLIGKMHTYVVAWVDPVKKYSTQVAKQGGTSPVWNEKLIIPVEQRLLDQANGMLMLKIHSHGSLSKKKVGSAQIPISEINRQNNQRMDYPVLRPSGKVQGTITISVLQEQISVPAPAAAPPITAYPAYNSNPAPPPGPYPPYQYPPPYTQYPPAGGYLLYPPPYYSQPSPPGWNTFAGVGLARGILGSLLGDLVRSASNWRASKWRYSGGGGDDGGGYDSGGGGDDGGGDGDGD